MLSVFAIAIDLAIQLEGWVLCDREVKPQLRFTAGEPPDAWLGNGPGE
jgi:hypothetical protein